MSSSAKIVLRKKPNAKGLYPLAIRITKNRRSIYKQLGHYIDLEDWDEQNIKVKKSHPNSKSLNSLISTKIAEARRSLIALQSESKDASARQIKTEIYRPTSSLTFFDYAKEHIEALEAEGKINRKYTDSAWLSFIERFHKSKQLTFQEIDERFLGKLKVFLKGKSSLTETSAMNVMVFIRLIYNRAIKDRVASKELYPFGNGRFKVKFPETVKIGLTKDEIGKFEAIQDLSSIERHSLNVWLFSFYFAGMRISDVLFTRWSQITDGRFNYRMGKNAKLLSLKIPEKAKALLKDYEVDKHSDDDFIFPEMKKADLDNPKDVYNKIKVATKKFNDNIKTITIKAKIRKKVTMHIARHSFGNIAGDAIHPLMLQKLYRHSDLKTTLNYQANFIHREADDALDSVINF
ncbi:tyrosine-type recombinase/integrase [Bizionia gelidisalsuginis]|uniref:Tyrosine-type recombinase/integrase n=1 Tax=Bizionia gelidisalsuginis TaxID=291188 RepID=A0ABY3M8K3_9FLAO|nr:site-specific integrase [Bizionia gelidisalsuginis]TYC10549.1 tyrosine-type recombinase/integrase [Bizionia gelidisalsuginis]